MSALPVPALNKIEEHALHFIDAHFATEGKMPASREVLRALGYKQSSFHVAAKIFLRLVEAGFLERTGHVQRGFQLAKTDYQYPADCSCGVCTNARNFTRLQLIQGLHVDAPDALIGKLRGLKPLSSHTKGYWLLGFPLAPTGSAA